MRIHSDHTAGVRTNLMRHVATKRCCAVCDDVSILRAFMPIVPSILAADSLKSPGSEMVTGNVLKRQHWRMVHSMGIYGRESGAGRYRIYHQRLSSRTHQPGTTVEVEVHSTSFMNHSATCVLSAHDCCTTHTSVSCQDHF